MKKFILSAFVSLICLSTPQISFSSHPVQHTPAHTAVVTPVDNGTEGQAEVKTKKGNFAEKFVNKIMASGKSQLVALLLALFVGFLGIHRFYLGYTVIGIIQLLTLGGFGIWALIDLIRIAIGDLQPKNGSYSKTL